MYCSSMASFSARRSWEGWVPDDQQPSKWGDPDDESSFDYSNVPADIAAEEFFFLPCTPQTAEHLEGFSCLPAGVLGHEVWSEGAN